LLVFWAAACHYGFRKCPKISLLQPFYQHVVDAPHRDAPVMSFLFALLKCLTFHNHILFFFVNAVLKGADSLTSQV